MCFRHLSLLVPRSDDLRIAILVFFRNFPPTLREALHPTGFSAEISIPVKKLSCPNGCYCNGINYY